MFRKIIFFIGLFLVLFSGTINLLANNQLTERLGQIDHLYKNFLISKNPIEIETAIKSLEDLIISYPDNYEVFWKAARSYNEYAALTSDPLKTYERAITYAQRSLELETNNPNAHFWLAVLYGQIGQAKGILNSLLLVEKMKDELEKCLHFDPKFDYAYHVLATLYLRAPGWPISIGDKNKALEYQLHAVKLNPNYLPYQWALYQIYDRLGKKDAAKEILQLIDQIPVEYSLESFYNEPITPKKIKEQASKLLQSN